MLSYWAFTKVYFKGYFGQLMHTLQWTKRIIYEPIAHNVICITSWSNSNPGGQSSWALWCFTWPTQYIPVKLRVKRLSDNLNHVLLDYCKSVLVTVWEIVCARKDTNGQLVKERALKCDPRGQKVSSWQNLQTWARTKLHICTYVLVLK